MNRLLVVLVVLPLLVAACAGRDADTPARGKSAAAASVPAPDAAPEFVTAAEAICSEMQLDATSIYGNAKATPTDEQVTRHVVRLRSGFDRLDALSPPPKRKSDVQQMLKHYRNMALAFDAMVSTDDEDVLGAVAVALTEGARGSGAARKAGIDACALFADIKDPAPDKQPMYEATRELVPDGASIVRGDAADCGKDGSCLFAYEIGGSVAARLSEARARLRANGWTDIRGERNPTESWLEATRNDYEVTIVLVGDVLPPPCKERMLWPCYDNVQVRRSESLEELFGG